MAEILKGAPIADAMLARMETEVTALKEEGLDPVLAILHVGEKHAYDAYERGAVRCSGRAGVTVRNVNLAEEATQNDLEAAIRELNDDETVHGILMLCPLPDHLDAIRAREMIAPSKDVDGCTNSSIAGVFTNTDMGFPPCTAQAIMEMLSYYGYEVEGKRVAIIGRSLVVGRPLGAMLMNRNATVVNCHTRTPDVPAVTREADILISAMGNLRAVGRDYIRPGQVVVDVGINWDEENKCIAGDVDRQAVEDLVSAITPVPGGVGTVTSAVLISHVVEAAKRTLQ